MDAFSIMNMQNTFEAIPTFEEALSFAAAHDLHVICDMKDTSVGIGALMLPILQKTNMVHKSEGAFSPHTPSAA